MYTRLARLGLLRIAPQLRLDPAALPPCRAAAMLPSRPAAIPPPPPAPLPSRARLRSASAAYWFYTQNNLFSALFARTVSLNPFSLAEILVRRRYQPVLVPLLGWTVQGTQFLLE